MADYDMIACQAVMGTNWSDDVKRVAAALLAADKVGAERARKEIALQVADKWDRKIGAYISDIQVGTPK